MKYSDQIIEELVWIHSTDFRLGEYIYMGMGILNGRKVCIAVAYKIDYCIKKGLQFCDEDPNVEFSHINKVKVGELVKEKQFSVRDFN